MTPTGSVINPQLQPQGPSALPGCREAMWDGADKDSYRGLYRCLKVGSHNRIPK